MELTALYFSVKSPPPKPTDYLELLIARGANVNATAASSVTPLLRRADEQNNLPAIAIPLSKSADLTPENEEDVHPWSEAVSIMFENGMQGVCTVVSCRRSSKAQVQQGGVATGPADGAHELHAHELPARGKNLLRSSHS